MSADSFRNIITPEKKLTTKLALPNHPQYESEGVSVFSHIKILQEEAIIARPQKLTSGKGNSFLEILLSSKELNN